MMIATTLILAMKALAVIGLLAGMLILLVGIRHFSLSPDPEETDALRDEMKDDHTVISSHSLFHDFILEDRKSDEENMDIEIEPAPRRIPVRPTRF